MDESESENVDKQEAIAATTSRQRGRASAARTQRTKAKAGRSQKATSHTSFSKLAKGNSERGAALWHKTSDVRTVASNMPKNIINKMAVCVYACPGDRNANLCLCILASRGYGSPAYVSPGCINTFSGAECATDYSCRARRVSMSGNFA